ncbi:Glyoxalase/bleomycin resistance protein/dioxygenase [Paenibacillus mucilaginosus 3016]|uniref:Glyoxalase/bleomycin resistance protein/dioxygenase n=2 Tax=Paenibacillus mucilaginosus TaxID=61624 RepID=H6NRG6_9BACL|nr:VOC family protein [Paenibacillus mucilaginosus]AFC33601.1 Glyoxalase/bleomycin resistance protein/dioxygenase [Paenibacillus mucilaginosus 3016]AFH65926.1 glyoxalase [Paenibacillus mucilaginosus K02]WFA21999.1 VOC family protein [Paenibacillus mucilaginosus]
MSITTKKALLKKVECAYIPVRDVAVSAAWYEEVLGLKRRSPLEPGRGAILLLGDGQWLFLLPCSDGAAAVFETTGWTDNGEAYEMFPLCFETEDIEGLHASLTGAGAWVEESIRDEGSCGKQLTFKDPDGNKFQAWQQP